MDLNLWVVTIAWSQSDHEKVLLNATSEKEAELKAKKQFPEMQMLIGASKIHHDCTRYT